MARLVFGIAFAHYLLHHGMAEYASLWHSVRPGGSFPGGRPAVGAAGGFGRGGGRHLGEHRLRESLCCCGSSSAGMASLSKQLASSPGPVPGGLGRMPPHGGIASLSPASAAVNLTSLIDLGSIMRPAFHCLRSRAILNMYGGLLPEGMTLSEIPNYLWFLHRFGGDGVNLVPALTVTFGTSALPAVSSSWAVKNYQATKRNIQSILRITALVATIPAAGPGDFRPFGPILNLLFSSRAAEAAIAAPVLRWMVAVILVAMASRSTACSGGGPGR